MEEINSVDLNTDYVFGHVPDSSSCKLLLPYSREPHLDMKIERIIRITKISYLI